MTAEDEGRVPRRRGRRIALAVAILLAGGAGVAWLSRVPIANRLIDRELGGLGVPARYRITDLGFGRQRLTNVVIGDPAAPDLVADWIETETDIGWNGPFLRGVRAGRVRLRGRLVDGTLSLGAIDRLMPASGDTTKPFALPALHVDLADARMRLETPQGLVGLRLAGRGRLDDGFRGSVAAVAPAIAAGGCTGRALNGVLSVTIRRGAPTLEGPVELGAGACAGTRIEQARAGLRLALNERLDRWQGAVGQVSVARAGTATAGAGIAGGTIEFAGDARRTQGTLDIALTRIGVPGLSAPAGQANGRYAFGAGGTELALALAAREAALDGAMRRTLLARVDAADGTPAGPLLRQAVRAAGAAAARFDLAADLTSDGTAVTVARAVARSASGATMRLGGDPAWRFGPARIGGALSIAGGGLPQVAARLAQRGDGAIAGRATIAPYAAGSARLALDPVDFVAGGRGETRIATRATLSGPLGDGRVESLAMPIDARLAAGGRFSLNPGCAPLSFATLATGGVTLRPARLTLCPTGAALLTVAGGAVNGGARINGVQLAGAMGTTALSLDARHVEARIGARGFAADGVAVRLGAADRITRLEIARLDGAATARGLAGTLSGGAGQIANVPLLLSAVDGRWQLAGGRLGVTGALRVADAAEAPRFRPLEGREVALGFADGRIGAAGVLVEPTTGTKVADVAIGHRLSDGSGTATLSVPGLTFAKGFQPDLLTPLTLGVIADVKGTVRGEGRIAWDDRGVTSTGAFRTDGTDLAAAVGPVEGLAGEIRFTDLLNMESAAGQVLTIRSVNPGVAVTDGRVVYQTLPGARVRIEGGRWPFAGGVLRLDPALLDFAAQAERHLTFRVDGVDAGQFLQQFEFENINATGTFDGVLPMIFDDTGGRIEGGTLAARPGGGSIAYVGELTEKDLGFWGNFAFQTLKSLTYRNLELSMNGPLAGEMFTAVRFAGVRQGKGAKSNFLVRRLTRLPIVFNINIRAPFRGLIDSAASFYDPKRLVQRNLQQLLEEQNRRQATPPIKAPSTPAAGARPVQPPASEIVP